MTDYLVSYSTKEYYRRHAELNESAGKFGLHNVISFYDHDLKATPFYQKNIEILINPKGAGFWLWKPYFIRRALDQIYEGDSLLYVDSGSLFVSGPRDLFNICKTNKTGILAFDTWPLNNSQWTKRDTFINLGADEPRYWEAKHIIATVIAFKKSKFTVDFVDEWLEKCQNVNSITDIKNINGKENLQDFIGHRMDQSILSILIEKYKIETYRNPSKWGNFLKMPAFREKGEYVGYPYGVRDSMIGYSPNPYFNSPYRTIFEFNRGPDQPTSEASKPNFYEKLLNKFTSYKRGKISK
jgi:hypothetical protein